MTPSVSRPVPVLLGLSASGRSPSVVGWPLSALIDFARARAAVGGPLGSLVAAPSPLSSARPWGDRSSFLVGSGPDAWLRGRGCAVAACGGVL